MSLSLVSASAMCTTNCSHYLDCDSHHGLYQCNCQAGFTGPNCDINIDECSGSPCVNGRCVDGVNRYDCVCNDGYWGTYCEKKIHNPEGKLRNTASISFWQDHCGCPERACSSLDDCVLCWEITLPAGLSISLLISRTHAYYSFRRVEAYFPLL